MATIDLAAWRLKFFSQPFCGFLVPVLGAWHVGLLRRKITLFPVGAQSLTSVVVSSGIPEGRMLRDCVCEAGKRE